MSADNESLLFGNTTSRFNINGITKEQWKKFSIAAVCTLVIIVAVGIVIGMLTRTNSAIVVPTTTPYSPTTSTTFNPTTEPTTITTSSTTTAPTTSTTEPSTTTTTKTSTTTTTTKTTTKRSTTTTVTTTTDKPKPTKYPPTRRPLPPNAETMNAISLLNYMGYQPNFTIISCAYEVPQVYKFNITIDNEFTFTSKGGDSKKDAKEGAAMTACQQMFQIRFKKPIPQPTFPCKIDFNNQTFTQKIENFFQILLRPIHNMFSKHPL